MKQHLDGDEGDVDCVTSTGLVRRRARERGEQ